MSSRPMFIDHVEHKLHRLMRYERLGVQTQLTMLVHTDICMHMRHAVKMAHCQQG
jgi:hypothetical protein